MKVKNLTPFPVGPKVTCRHPPQREVTLVARGRFRLAPGEPLAPFEGLLGQGFLTSDVFAEDDDERAGECLYPSDFADFKPSADLLLRGTCHPPSGPVALCPVRFAVGAWSKSVVVVGRRVWTERVLGPAISEPAPFARMPVDYAHAFGGPDHPDNPVGIGLGAGGARAMELPNLELPAAPIRSRADRPAPACFGPQNPAWAPRRGKLGKQYGEAYRKKNAPFYADDFDWSHFNAAPEDQRLPRYLRGDEELVFENLHPDAARFVTRLPGLRLRAFVHCDDRPIVEAVMNLDTLFADLDEGTLTLTWRGLAPVREDDLKDVRTVLVASEPLGSEPLAFEHYARVLEAFEADPLEREKHLPPELGPNLQALQKQLADPALSRDDKLAAAYGAMAGEVPPEDRPAVAQAGAKLREDLAAAEARFASLPAKPGNDGGAAGAGAARAKAVDEALARVEQLKQAALARGADPKAIEDATAPLRDPEVARLVGLGPPRIPGPGKDLSGADFSGQDLTGMDLTGSNLTGARLMGTKLAGCKLAGADLTKALLNDADLTRADLRGARLAQAFFNGARLVGANLARVALDRCFFMGADLTGATLEGATGRMVAFGDATLRDLDARGAELLKAFSSGADLERADFTGAKLVHCMFVHAKARGIRFGDAVLDGTSFAGSDVSEAFAVGVLGDRSIWSGSLLDDADFRHAELADAFFNEARGERTRLFAANLRKANLYRATLVKADLTSANLFRANLCKTTLTETSFRGANLFQAQLLGAVSVRCDFADANTLRAMFQAQ